MQNGLIALINILVLGVALIATVTLIRASASSSARSGPIFVIVAATLIGLANAYLPALAALRDQLVFVQPLMVLGMVTLLLTAGLTLRGRDFFRAVHVKPLIGLHSWRVLFGLLLLVAGLMGALPPAFFWSVAFGDIVAGLWAIAMWRRSTLASPTELKLWSAFGLFDLLHVLPRAVVTLPPFYLANPDVFRPVLLPLLGVPMLIALHILLLQRFIADGKTNGESSF
jgi:hypothetical protein